MENGLNDECDYDDDYYDDEGVAEEEARKETTFAESRLVYGWRVFVVVGQSELLERVHKNTLTHTHNAESASP